MTPQDIPIIHPASYGFRSNLVRLTNRANAAADAAQKSWLTDFLVEVQTAITAELTLDPADTVADSPGHGGRGIKWLSKDIAYRSITTADIKTDATNIITAITAALI